MNRIKKKTLMGGWKNMEQQKISGGTLIVIAIIFIILLLLFPVFTVWLLWIAIAVMICVGIINILIGDSD